MVSFVRFDGALNVDMTESKTNLVQCPRIHFIPCIYFLHAHLVPCTDLSFTHLLSSPLFSLSTPQPYPYHCIPSYFQSHHTCQAHYFPISHAHLAHHHTHTSILTLIFMPHACTHQTHSTLPPFLSLQTLLYPFHHSSFTIHQPTPHAFMAINPSFIHHTHLHSPGSHKPVMHTRTLILMHA